MLWATLQHSNRFQDSRSFALEADAADLKDIDAVGRTAENGPEDQEMGDAANPLSKIASRVIGDL
jgi:hypothetical protein